MIENALDEVRKRLDAQNEWLLVRAGGRSFALRGAEIEISFERDKFLFGFLSDKGFQTWRVRGCRVENGEIALDLTKNFGREKERVRLVPRVSHGELGAAVEQARLEKAGRVGRLIEENVPGARLLRVELNEASGRFAQIVFAAPRRRQTAVLADVSASLSPEILLTAAVVRLSKLENRKKDPVGELWILSEKREAKKLQKLHALLKDVWKKKIRIFQTDFAREAAADRLEELPALSTRRLWKTGPQRAPAAETLETSEAARAIARLAPGEIDLVRSRHGETLRFLGLPFARVRRIFEREKIWFGVERDHTILTGENERDLIELVENLKTYRRFDSPNKRHAFYLSVPEAWLEAVLRRNIKLLDANLILSPLHRQFRAGRERVDLLALRRDGRLVVVELKVAPDREAAFQAADYWRKIERERRKGNLEKARIFGDLAIADRPALVYLAAPTLSFHRDFEFLAGTIAPEIELYRFDLNENWRETVRVTQRKLRK